MQKNTKRFRNNFRKPVPLAEQASSVFRLPANHSQEVFNLNLTNSTKFRQQRDRLGLRVGIVTVHRLQRATAFELSPR